MSTMLRTINIPLFIKVEEGSLKNIARTLEEHHLHFRKPLILSEPKLLELGGNDVVTALHGPATVMLQNNSIAEALELAQEIRTQQNDLLISIGGGRVLDVGKYAATKAGINYISIPTAPSNDGICSPNATLQNDEGRTESVSVNMPIGILVDTHILESAPEQNIRAGIGDAISNFSAIEDWRLAYRDGQDVVDDFAASIAFSGAQLIFETCKPPTFHLHDPFFLRKLMHGLILSGIAMNIAGSSRPCSGSEHKISHAIDLLFPGRSIHGLQVAMATLFVGFLRKENIRDLYFFFHAAHLPTIPKELHLTDDEFEAAIERAPSTRANRYTILEKLQLSHSDIHEQLKNFYAHCQSLNQS